MAGKSDGGPAFPEAVAISPDGSVIDGRAGMTLRDYFAAGALRGMLAAGAVDCSGIDKTVWSLRAYDWADAMLRAREL